MMGKLTIFVFLLCQVGLSGGLVNVSPVGGHYEIFRLEKSENTQNILVVYTRLDEQCRFVLNSQDSSLPEFGFYWLLDGKKYKPLHSLIKLGVSARLKVIVPQNFITMRDQFFVQVKDLSQIDSTLQDSHLKVFAVHGDAKDCFVRTTFDVDRTGDNSSMELHKIYAESVTTFWPPFRRVVALRFDGIAEKTGQIEQKEFKEKNK